MRYSRYIRATTLVTASLAVLASCAYVIPPDPNAPRNNTVNGELRRPQLNGAVGPQSALPPVDGVVKAQAERELAVASAPVTSVEAAPLDTTRRPAMNGAYQVAASGYPPLESVPPRPALDGPDSSRERLNESRSTLETDRVNASTQAEKLKHDAAAEPSMLSQLPESNAATLAAPGVSAPQAVPSIAPPQIAPQHIPAVKKSEPVTEKPQASTIEQTPSPLAVSAAPVRVNTAPANAQSATIDWSNPVFQPPKPLGAMPVPPAPVKPVPLAAAPVETLPVAAAPLPAPQQATGNDHTAAYASRNAVASAPTAPADLSKPITYQNVDSSPLPSPAPGASLSTTSVKPSVAPGDFNPLAVGNSEESSAPSAVPVATIPSVYASTRYLPPSRYTDRRM